MNRHLTVAAVTAAFGQIVEQAATEAVADAGVHFARPDTTGTEPKVYIYLYQTVVNPAARNLELPVRSSAGVARQRPFTALDLHYLLTFVGDESKLQPQRMMGSVASSVHGRPLLSPAAIRQARVSAAEPPLIGDDLDVPVVDVNLTLLGLSLDELSKVWSVFFQTPYGLSVVYRASMVLLEADVSVQPPLPAQRPRGESGFLAHPAVARVVAEAGQYQPITVDSTLLILGTRLQGEQTLVRVAGTDVEPAQTTASRITLPVPVSAHVVGAHTVRVVHRPWDAVADDASNEVESNAVSFVLIPKVTDVSSAGALVSVDISPVARSEQRAEVLLDQLDVENPASYRLACLAFEGDSTSNLQADLTGVVPGRYAVRVRVDGIASRIDIDLDTDTVVHVVEVPLP